MRTLFSVKEAFYTLQGEGAHAGLPAVFVRFAGCNLWTGREEDRASGSGGCSRWCDTDFVGLDGLNGGRYTAEGLADLVKRLWPGDRPRVVLTGGEPLLQVTADLVGLLLAARCWVAVETNGTRLPPPGIDWVCVSPKAGAPVALTEADEVKLVWPQEVLDPEKIAASIAAKHYCMQPKAGDPASIAVTLAYVQAHPRWRLSLQLHKLLGIP